MAEYADRVDAGAALALAVIAVWAPEHPRAEPPLVLGLPRGGVPIAALVAAALHADLDVLPVRKVSVPGQPELAVGAVAEGGTAVVDERIRIRSGLSDEALAHRIAAAATELGGLGRRWRSGRDPIPLAGRDVVIVDDGLATGSTARAAVRAALTARARSVTVAVPVGPVDSIRALEREGATVICPVVPSRFHAVGLHYRDFSQTSDDEVVLLLDRQP